MKNTTSRVQAQSPKSARKHTTKKSPADDSRERYAAALQGGFLSIEMAQELVQSCSGPAFEKARELFTTMMVETAAAAVIAAQAQLARG